MKEDVVALHPREVDRFLKKIKTQDAFIRFINDGNLDQVTPYIFTDMLGCTQDASPEVISSKYERIMAMAVLVSDNHVIDFLHNCRDRFTRLFNYQGG